MDALTARMNRELIKYAVQRKIFCDLTGNVLDMARAVVIDVEADQKVIAHMVLTASAWDEAGESIMARLAHMTETGQVPAPVVIDVLDGRDYFTPGGRARAASKIED